MTIFILVFQAWVMNRILTSVDLNKSKAMETLGLDKVSFKRARASSSFTCIYFEKFINIYQHIDGKCNLEKPSKFYLKLTIKVTQYRWDYIYP